MNDKHYDMWYDDSLFTETMQTIVIMNIINDYNDYILLYYTDYNGYWLKRT